MKIKKLARISLYTPPHGTVLCMVLIFNVIKRHPTTIALIHKIPKEKKRKSVLFLKVKERMRKRKLQELNQNEEEKEKGKTKQRALLTDDSDDDDNDDEEEECENGEDLFDFYQPDPYKSNAENSSLWEFEAIKNHALPSVSNLLSVFQKSFRRSSFEINKFSSYGYGSIFSKQLERKITQVPLDHNFNGSIFHSHSDKSFSGWSI